MAGLESDRAGWPERPHARGAGGPVVRLSLAVGRDRRVAARGRDARRHGT